MKGIIRVKFRSESGTDQLFTLNSSFNYLCASLTVTSGLDRDTNSVLDLSVFVMTDKDRKFRASMSGCLRSVTLLTAAIPAGVLVVLSSFVRDGFKVARIR
jgi:hypothetical protein